MKRKPQHTDWLPLAKKQQGGDAEPPTGEAFQTGWIDFERGIRVGNLEPHERITQILKYFLEQTYRTRFITDRWGRGVFWQWICWLPRRNREVKPISNHVNFGCAKLFITVDRGQRIFKCGLQVERGYAGTDATRSGWVLQADWDWHRLVRQATAHSALDALLGQLLVEDGFVAEVGGWQATAVFDRSSFRSASAVGEALKNAYKEDWAGFQLYYPFPEAEVKAMQGNELAQAMKGVFTEVVPAMNLCMQIDLEACAGGTRPPWERQ